MKSLAFRLLAAITFFTRIPIWKKFDIPSGSFSGIICFWPLTGYITGGFTALVWLAASYVFPPLVAVILAFVFRVLFTGGFHEDGLGDFFDGFGGGRSKTDILRIMKDSHVGSYAVIGFVLYYALLFSSVKSIPVQFIATAIFVADPLSKLMALIPMNLLPYARTESESKSKTLFDKLKFGEWIFVILTGLLPMFLLLSTKLWWALIPAIGTMLVIYLLLRKKLNGYTGDTCGATALICELVFFLGISACCYLLV